MSETYPSADRPYAMSYVHTRNEVYKRHGLEPVVLSFQAEKSYEYKGIKVITQEEFESLENKDFEIAISHAPNYKHHLRFLYKHHDQFNQLLMFFHGHEALNHKDYYPKPFPYAKKERLKWQVYKIYDPLKLQQLKKFQLKMMKKNKIHLIFVSDWMKEQFKKNLNFDEQDIKGISHVINNSANSSFLNSHYTPAENLRDVIVIRPFDEPKYGIDIVVEIAKNNPELSFDLYGKGKYFDYHPIPPNVNIISRFIEQDQIPEVLNGYRMALMPTRLDAQGVMACEMAVYGIPLVTSDLEICLEMLSDFPNVYFMENSQTDLDLKQVLDQLPQEETLKSEIRNKFGEEATVYKEVELIRNLLNK